MLRTSSPLSYSNHSHLFLHLSLELTLAFYKFSLCLSCPTKPSIHFSLILLCLAELNSMATTSATDRKLENELPSAFDGIAPPPAFTSATSSTLPCDVFINHRGPDVKYTLATAIYRALAELGLRAFLDMEELELGDFLPKAIEEAMRTASLHIAIFSENYSQSPWCLAELSFMLQTDTYIIPVFYHVDPSDLRWVAQGKGIYAKAFSDHEKKGRYTLPKLEEWKMALHRVSFYTGEIVNNNDDERRLVKKIVNRALKVMNRVPLVVAKHPIGLHEFAEDFEMTTEASQGYQNVQIVGIWGMGGSGKTTLAKEIYNKKCLSMDRSSFVFHIRDAEAKSGLHNKQMRLLEDLGVKGVSFDNTERGKAILASRLRTVRVLIILDDVDHIDQMDALLPPKDSLGRGSLIIVTTRDKEVLKSWGISSIYEMKNLDPLHAKQLFCWHAFSQASPPEGFEDLVQKFLNFCNGLPLSLKVFGQQLAVNSSTDYWESQLHKLRSGVLPNPITERLKVSYDALDDQEKKIFLEIACFSIGKQKNLAIEEWDRLGWSGLHSWETLVSKCLVDLDKHNCIRMHDHFRDLGRKISNRQFPRHTINLQKQEEKSIAIEGINPTTAGSTSEVREFPLCSRPMLPYCTGAEKIGVNNGLMGDNLPPAEEVVILMQNNNIGKLRIYKAEPLVLEAFANSGIEIIVGVANFELQNISLKQEFANEWVYDYIKPYYPATNIKYIAVGNQALEKREYGLYVLRAMNNIQIALENANLQHNIKVSTTHGRAVIPMSLFPSKGTFTNTVKNKMRSVLQFLDQHGSPYMANVYPYFGYLENAKNISLDYALFKSTDPVVKDGDSIYTNLFEAMVDSIYSAMEALGFYNIPIVVTESGWPSYGTAEKAMVATIENAQTYNNNLIKHVLSKAGTPKRRGRSMEACIFALFNENMKSGDETERHFGLFHPNKQPVYSLHFST